MLDELLPAIPLMIDKAMRSDRGFKEGQERGRGGAHLADAGGPAVEYRRPAESRVYQELHPRSLGTNRATQSSDNARYARGCMIRHP